MSRPAKSTSLPDPIKTFKPSYQLSFDRRVKEANPGSFFSLVFKESKKKSQ
jgi:hypothetical protein